MWPIVWSILAVTINELKVDFFLLCVYICHFILYNAFTYFYVFIYSFICLTNEISFSLLTIDV